MISLTSYYGLFQYQQATGPATGTPIAPTQFSTGMHRSSLPQRPGRMATSTGGDVINYSTIHYVFSCQSREVDTKIHADAIGYGTACLTYLTL